MILKDRIAAVRNHTGLNISQFSHRVGFKTPQTIRELESGRTRSLSYEVLNKILHCYPEINGDWLKTGEGEMLNPKKEFNQSNSGGNNQQIDKVGDNADLRTGTFFETCPEDQKRINKLEREVGDLKGKLAHKEDVIHQMKKTEKSQENRINESNERISELKERIEELKERITELKSK